jgi:hypothetical protein
MKRTLHVLLDTRRGNRWLTGLPLAALFLAYGVAAAFRWTPVGLFAPCVFLRVTGWRCPACGATRMVGALLRGDLAAAWYYHPLLLLALAVAAAGGAALFLRTFCKGWRPLSPAIRSRWWLLLPAVLVFFFLVRNTAFYQRIFY